MNRVIFNIALIVQIIMLSVPALASGIEDGWFHIESDREFINQQLIPDIQKPSQMADKYVNKDSERFFFKTISILKPTNCNSLFCKIFSLLFSSLKNISFNLWGKSVEPSYHQLPSPRGDVVLDMMHHEGNAVINRAEFPVPPLLSPDGRAYLKRIQDKRIVKVGYANQPSSLLLSMPNEVLLNIMQYRGAAKATGTVCRQLEILRMHPTVPLITRYPSQEALENACANYRYRKSGIELQFSPEYNCLKLVAETIPNLTCLRIEYIVTPHQYIMQVGQIPNLVCQRLIDIEAPYQYLLQLGQLVNLRELNLKGNELGSEGAQALAGSLPKLVKLQILDLSVNYLGPQGAQSLAEAIAPLVNLLNIGLRYNCFDAEGLEALAAPFSQLVNLQSLDLFDAHMGSQGAQALAEVLPQLKNLKVLNLGFNELGPQGAQYLSRPLPHLVYLRNLNLNYNDLGPEGLQALAAALTFEKNLRSLSLDGNNLNFQAAQYLAGALPQMENLKELHLYNNALGPQGAQALSEVFPQIKSLKVLDLGHNELGPQGVQYLARVLQQMVSLRDLELSRNMLGPQGAQALAEVMPQIKNLKFLNLKHNELSPESIETLEAQNREGKIIIY